MAIPGSRKPGWQRAIRVFACAKFILSIEETQLFAYFLKTRKFMRVFPCIIKNAMILCVYSSHITHKNTGGHII